MLFTEVAAPTLPARLSTNLLASAERPTDEAAGRWMSGYVWRSDSCPEYQGFNPCAELAEWPELGGGDLHYFQPVGYRVADRCSTLGGRLDDARVRAQAEGVASYAVARELWTGELSAAEPFDIPGGGVGQVNPRLASPAATTLPTTTDVMDAVAELECSAREATKGVGPIFIHGSCRVLGRAADKFRRVGNELRTATDAVVIPDSGYPGTGPDGTGTGWLYATGPVVVRLGPLAVEADPGATIGRRDNVQRVTAGRLFAAAFDPCVHFAIQVT